VKQSLGCDAHALFRIVKVEETGQVRTPVRWTTLERTGRLLAGFVKGDSRRRAAFVLRPVKHR
jgi:hypothetical protein